MKYWEFLQQMREWQQMIPPMKHSNINLPPEEDDKTTEERIAAANQSELAVFTGAALETIREMAGPDRKFDVVIILGDPESNELILTGGCCAGCTANMIEAAHKMVQRLDRDGYIEVGNEPTPTN